MYRFVILCACVLALSGCDLIDGLLGTGGNTNNNNGGDGVEVDLADPIFSRSFSGDSNEAFAIITLYQDAFLQSRLVLEAIKNIDSMDFDLALPECLKLAGGSNTGSYQWKALFVEPGIYEKIVDWERFKPDCPPNGTLFYTISSGPVGESGSIPFDWLEN